MFENHNEIELLSLMLNKDEFLRYITQQYNENNCCTQLDPLIWATHLNIPKHERLPLLEKIFLQNMNYIKMRYSFLPDKQIQGKTYEVLGIPTICGEPNKYFLNTYKKYKSYYPRKCMKNKKTSELNNYVNCDSIGLDTSQHCSKRYPTPPIVNQEITSSTPITKKISNFKLNLLLSPISTPIEDENHILSTDIFYNKDSNFKNIKNKPQNKYGEQILSKSKTLESSSVNVINTSQHIFNEVQSFDVTETKNMDDTQSQVFFISRNPKHIQVSNNTILSYDNDLNNTWNEESYSSVKKDENSSISIYFDDLKKEKNQESIFETPNNLSKEKHSTVVSKECLSVKIKKNLDLTHLKNVRMTKTHRSRKLKSKTKKSHSKSKMNESWKRKKQNFSDNSLSDLDNPSYTPITMKNSVWINKYHSKIEQVSLKLKYNDTWVKNIKNLSTDIESLSYSSREYMKTNTKPFLKLNLSEQEENIKHDNVSNTSHMSSLMFSRDSIFLPNLKSNNSNQTNSTIYKFMNESQDSCDSNYNFKENDTKNNKIAISFDKILFEDIPETTLQKNLSLLSAIDTSLSSICTANTSTHTAPKVQSK